MAFGITKLEDPDGQPVTAKGTADGFVRVAVVGSAGSIDQGASNGAPGDAWAVRISDGASFIAPLTDTQLRATPVPISGAVSVTPAAQTTTSFFPVRSTDGTNFYSSLNGAPTQFDRPRGDAYQRSLTVQPHKVLSVRFLFGLNTDDIGTLLALGGTITWNSSIRAASLNITGASGDAARIGTHRCSLSNSSRSGGPTIQFQTGTVGVNNQYTVYLASSDLAYGFGVREQNSAISIVIRHPGVGGEALIPKSVWNIDKLDGTGPSGATITTLNTTIHTLSGRGSGDGGHSTIIILNGIPVHFLGPVPSVLVFPGNAWRIQCEAKNTGVGVAGSLLVRALAFDIEGAESNDEFKPKTLSLSVDKTATTTELPLMAIRPSATAGGVPNDTSLFPLEFVPVFDTGFVEFRAYYQRGGVDPLGGTGAWSSSTNSPHDTNTTATSWAPNANTEYVDFTGTAHSGDTMGLSAIFGDGQLLAVRRRFNDAADEMFIITVKTRAASHPSNGILKFGVQNPI